MKKLLSIASFLILAFGFMYISWHVGRAYAKADNQEVTIILQDIEDCKVHKALIFELVEPSGKYEIHTKYEEYSN